MNRKRLVLIVCIVFVGLIFGYSYFGQPTVKTIQAVTTEYENKIAFRGVYFAQEFVEYRGKVDPTLLLIHDGQKIPRGVGIYQNLLSDQAGVLLSYIDGYESKFSLSTVFGYDYNQLGKTANQRLDGIKILNNSEWYVYAATKDSERYHKYRSYNILFDNGIYPAEVVKSVPKDNYCYTVFKIKNDLNILNLHRYLNGYIIKSVYDGVVVPEHALVTQDGKQGIYIKFHGYAEFRRVDVKFRGNDIAVIVPSEIGKTIQEYDELLADARNVKEGDKIR